MLGDISIDSLFFRLCDSQKTELMLTTNQPNEFSDELPNLCLDTEVDDLFDHFSPSDQIETRKNLRWLIYTLIDKGRIKARELLGFATN